MSDPETLISAWLDGELDGDGVRALDDWLAEDPQHQRRYLTAVIDHRTLQQRAAAGRFAAAAPRAAPRRSGRHRSAPRLRWLPAALAAGLVLSAAGGWAWWRGRGHASVGGSAKPAVTAIAMAAPAIESAVAVQLLHADGRAEAAAGTALAADDRLVVGVGGYATVRCADGTVIRVAGDSEATIADGAGGKRVAVTRGRVAADVEPQAPGHAMVFATPEAEVTVVGTSLTVSSIAGESLTEVSHGRVSMRRLADRAEVPITAGESALVAPGLPLVARPIGAPAGNRYAVGAGQAYATIDALPELHPGDLVEIHPGTYRTAKLWTASGTALRPITIRGVGAAPTIIDGDGFTLTGVGLVPRALFQFSGEHWRIEHLSFINAHNGTNAAGIRCAGSRHTEIRDCRISRCDAGIAAEDDDLLIERCDVGGCGTTGNDGHCHLLALDGARAVVRGCNLHDALNGQALKSGNRWLEVRGCRIADAEDGEIGLIDGPGSDQPGSAVVMIGNLVVSKPGRRGNNQRFIEIGGDNGGVRRGTLYLFRNTLVAADPRNVIVSTIYGEVAVVADSNIVVGSDQIAHLGSSGISGSRNWLPPTAKAPAGLRDSLPSTAAGPGFTAPRDFRLRIDSPCVGRAADSHYRDGEGRQHPALPDLEPPRDANTTVLSRGKDADVGAFAAGR